MERFLNIKSKNLQAATDIMEVLQPHFDLLNKKSDVPEERRTPQEVQKSIIFLARFIIEKHERFFDRFMTNAYEMGAAMFQMATHYKRFSCILRNPEKIVPIIVKTKETTKFIQDPTTTKFIEMLCECTTGSSPLLVNREAKIISLNSDNDDDSVDEDDDITQMLNNRVFKTPQKTPRKEKRHRSENSVVHEHSSEDEELQPSPSKKRVSKNLYSTQEDIMPAKHEKKRGLGYIETSSEGETSEVLPSLEGLSTPTKRKKKKKKTVLTDTDDEDKDTYHDVQILPKTKKAKKKKAAKFNNETSTTF